MLKRPCFSISQFSQSAFGFSYTKIQCLQLAIVRPQSARDILASCFRDCRKTDGYSFEVVAYWNTDVTNHSGR